MTILSQDDEQEIQSQEFVDSWDLACEDHALVSKVEQWERIPAPTAVELEAREAGLARARAALAAHRERSMSINNVQPGASRSITATSAPDCEAALAALFDPVTVAALATMFRLDKRDQWQRWAERASDNGLKTARVGRAKFNPYSAAQWFLAQGIPGWDRARVNGVLADSLPPRSHDMRSRFLP